MAHLPNVRRRHHVHPFKDYCGVCWMSPVEPGSSCSGSRQDRADPRGPGEKAYDAARAEEQSRPDGWRELRSASVFMNETGKLVVLARADEVWPIEDDGDEHPHNCDRMGCSSMGGHVIHRGNLEEEL